MKILVVAPQPFYTERGTPIAVRLLLETLIELGHEVDCLTMPFGKDPGLDGVQIHRCVRPWGIRSLPIGFSASKLICDISLGFSLLRRVLSKQYDVIHAVEESAYLARCVRALRGIPYIYDMDSSLAEQIQESHPGMHRVAAVLRAIEKRAIRGSIAVAAVCPSLGATAVKADGSANVSVIEDIAFESDVKTDTDLRKETGESAPLLLYVGNLETYQGIDLLLQSFVEMRREVPGARLAIVGGNAEHIEAARARALELGDEGAVRFLGPRPLQELPSLLTQADILVSPRLVGRNTPMKIYSYLNSGVPVVATAIESHTQVLDESTGWLADPEPKPFARGLIDAWRDREGSAARAERARRLVHAEYSRDAFRRKLGKLYESVQEGLRPA